MSCFSGDRGKGRVASSRERVAGAPQERRLGGDSVVQPCARLSAPKWKHLLSALLGIYHFVVFSYLQFHPKSHICMIPGALRSFHFSSRFFPPAFCVCHFYFFSFSSLHFVNLFRNIFRSCLDIVECCLGRFSAIP